MLELRLGTRYAKSILELAKERKELDEVVKDFQYIYSVCNSNPDFVAMLKSPMIQPDKKDRIIKMVLDRCKPTEMTVKFIEIIVRKRREVYLYDIADRFLYLYDKEKNITRGVLISAQLLDEAQKAIIVKSAEKAMDTNFFITEKIDPDLIGGFILKVGDKIYDGSLSAGLRKLKNEFEGNPYIKEQ